MNISDVFVGNKVATTSSFTKAARQVGSSCSSVSKKIGRLEGDLDVVLINRSTHRVSLTEAGRIFPRHTSELNAMMEHAADVVRGTDRQPTGTVALSIPSSLGAALMPSLNTQFQTSWPDLKFSIDFEDHVIDLIAGGYDLAIRISQTPTDSSLISRRLGSTRKILAASPGYLKRFGNPANLQDLKNHRCLGFGGAVNAGTPWLIRDLEAPIEVPCTFPVGANNPLALVLAACLDNGIVYMPEICISNELAQRRLKPILLDSYLPEICGIFAVFPHCNAPTSVKVLVKFIERKLTLLGLIDRRTPLAGSIDHNEQCAVSNREL